MDTEQKKFLKDNRNMLVAKLCGKSDYVYTLNDELTAVMNDVNGYVGRINEFKYWVVFRVLAVSGKWLTMNTHEKDINVLKIEYNSRGIELMIHEIIC